MENINNTLEMMKILLAMEYTLLIQTQKYHWNVTGRLFSQLHKLFGKQYKKLFKLIDRIAEAIRKNGGISPGSIVEFYNYNLNSNYPVKENLGEVKTNDIKMVEDLKNNHQQLIKYIMGIKFLDLADENLIADILEYHKTSKWMLSSYFE